MKREEASQLVNMGMSTIMMHKAYGRNADVALKEVRKEAARLEKLMSRFVEGSDISKINMSSGKKEIELSEATFFVLSRAIKFSADCNGLFDVTVGPLVSLWNSFKDRKEPPEEDKIKKLLLLINYKDILIDPSSKKVGLRRVGQSIDLGGIGKGYAADQFIRILKKHNIKSAFTNIGGNVYALGKKPDGSLWKVGIQHPREDNRLIGSVSVADKAVVTSGDYQRFYIGNNGERYHHILNVQTGYPVKNGLVSVSIIADDSVTADALSTIVFAAGLEEGLKLLKKYPGVEAVLIDKELKVHLTDDLKVCFQLF